MNYKYHLKYIRTNHKINNNNNQFTISPISVKIKKLINVLLFSLTSVNDPNLHNVPSSNKIVIYIINIYM